MVKRGFKDLNEVERNLSINGVIVLVALKKCVRIGRNNAIKILEQPTLKKQKASMSKIRNRCKINEKYREVSNLGNKSYRKNYPNSDILG